MKQAAVFDEDVQKKSLPCHFKLFTYEEGLEPMGMILRCPGCGALQGIRFDCDPTAKVDGHDTWKWNDSREKPSLTPSLHHRRDRKGCGWHGYLTDGIFDGKIEGN